MNNLMYGINPPKLIDGHNLYYRDIIVLIIENDAIIGARKYDLDGTFKVIPYNDIKFDGTLKKYRNDVAKVNISELTINILRETWIFDSEEKAFIQKVLLLSQLREEFDKDQNSLNEEFSKKIPKNISSIFTGIKEKRPEYFL